MNQFYLEISIRRMVCPVGVDVDFYDEYNCKNELHNIIIQAGEWDLYQQYESGFQTLRYYSLFNQNSTVIVHHEIFEYQIAMELFRAPYFDMYNNVSKKTAIRPCKDLTKRIKNKIVLVGEFMFEDKARTVKYEKFTHHTMINEIHLDRLFGVAYPPQAFGLC